MVFGLRRSLSETTMRLKLRCPSRTTPSRPTRTWPRRPPGPARLLARAGSACSRAAPRSRRAALRCAQGSRSSCRLVPPLIHPLYTRGTMFFFMTYIYRNICQLHIWCCNISCGPDRITPNGFFVVWRVRWCSRSQTYQISIVVSYFEVWYLVYYQFTI